LDAPGTSASSSKETIYHASEAVLHQRTYFNPTLLAYTLGLGAAFAANSITHLGQPALLYLVPLTLGAVAAVAASRCAAAAALAACVGCAGGNMAASYACRACLWARAACPAGRAANAPFLWQRCVAGTAFGCIAKLGLQEEAALARRGEVDKIYSFTDTVPAKARPKKKEQ
jgi:hypothetical protein